MEAAHSCGGPIGSLFHVLPSRGRTCTPPCRDRELVNPLFGPRSTIFPTMSKCHNQKAEEGQVFKEDCCQGTKMWSLVSSFPLSQGTIGTRHRYPAVWGSGTPRFFHLTALSRCFSSLNFFSRASTPSKPYECAAALQQWLAQLQKNLHFLPQRSLQSCSSGCSSSTGCQEGGR